MSLEVNVTKRFDGFTLHAAFTAGEMCIRDSL